MKETKLKIFSIVFEIRATCFKTLIFNTVNLQQSRNGCFKNILWMMLKTKPLPLDFLDACACTYTHRHLSFISQLRNHRMKFWGLIFNPLPSLYITCGTLGTSFWCRGIRILSIFCFSFFNHQSNMGLIKTKDLYYSEWIRQGIWHEVWQTNMDVFQIDLCKCFAERQRVKI